MALASGSALSWGLCRNGVRCRAERVGSSRRRSGCSTSSASPPRSLGFVCACSSTAPVAAAPASSGKRTIAKPRRGEAVQLRRDRSIQPSVSAAHTAAATTTIRTSPAAPRTSRPDHHAGDSGEKKRGPARVCERHGDHRRTRLRRLSSGRPARWPCRSRCSRARAAQHQGLRRRRSPSRHPRAPQGASRAAPHRQRPEARTSPSPTS